MDIKFNFDDVKQKLNEIEDVRLLAAIDKVGKEAVEYAKEHGSYKDRTGNLRASNEYEVHKDKLILRNTANYASYVEAKGFEVLATAAVYAEKRLKEELE